MLTHSRRIGAVIAVVVLNMRVVGAQTTTSPSSQNPLTGDPQAIKQGAVLFRQECTYCHGVAARGGMRGPDLTTGSWSHGGADGDLARTIGDGVAGTAMPPNKLTGTEIWQIVAYLRTLQQAPAAAKGDAGRGEALFAGALRCASCHIVNGRGGRLGPELTTVGSARSRAYIVESIREPNKHLTEIRGLGEASMKFDTVSLTTADGRTITGVPINEDTFTVQVMDHGRTRPQFRQEDAESLPPREPLDDAGVRHQPPG